MLNLLFVIPSKCKYSPHACHEVGVTLLYSVLNLALDGDVVSFTHWHLDRGEGAQEM